MAETKFDLLVIGGGPGGYVAAIRAAQLGLKTALVEKEHLGGICLNWGCIPTKALLRSAEVYRNAQHADSYGLKINGLAFDLKKIVDRSRAISKQLNSGVGHLLKKNKVTVFDGFARLLGGGSVEVEKDGKPVDQLSAKNIILATGARARVFPGLEPDGDKIWTYREALIPAEMPKSLLVVGSGAIGIEFASFYLTMGADVTVVEVLDQIMPVEDAEISQFARKSMEQQGMKIHTGTKVKSLKKVKNGIVATLESGGKTSEVTVDKVITAVGVTPNTENIGLDKAGVKLDEKGFIATDEWCKTSASGVFAIGDVAGAPCLAHKASHEAIICVEKISGQKDVHPLDHSRIPGCTYCHPQVASVGLTEKRAIEKGYKVKVGRFPFMGNGKAIALGEAEGLVKTIFDAKTGELLGAHMVGAEVTELIQGYTVAKTLETTEADLMHTVFPHPTLSEMMHESVLDAYGRAIHF
ncbi:MAG: dihydrolipoyl dehydrogenase [Rhodospirillales bacterium]|nr:dihydrolipoyl dehydrogenase [Rhodospirillales bacterium]MCW8861085.1 dihydrolipoyl dehydrogenase [Rhodospirillales bacterium]MCW8951290.1 dihydrolipoyl dehydrogenase [Rhodospirillales bacterium]MCW8970269.1 dihydrolipoyl dehydrogenase [Rhodospirillales bacterium]MCW9002322.1 dihydrolipoyl dehydrogenase [Rhodospirillales bacterium]